MESPDGWISAIASVLESDTPESRQRRIEYAQDNTWDRRVAELVAVIEASLASQPRASGR